MSKDTKIENAIISKTFLGIEDHGFFTFFLHLSGNGWGCGFGGHCLGTPDKPSAFAAAAIMAVLRVLEVETWEDLRGQAVRAETEGFGGGVKRLGHLIKEQWVDLKELAEQMKKDGTL